jgi:hemerythrin
VYLERDLESSVGVETLDAEHRHVRRRLRQLASAAAEGRADEVRGALRHLHADLAERQAAEERWIAEAGYPGEREHARAHRALLDRIGLARDGEARALFGAAREIGEALEAHLRFDDLKLGRFWTARQNLRRLAEGPGGGALLTPIPGTPLPSPAPGARTPPPAARVPPPARTPPPADAAPAEATSPPESRRAR